jgi:hypothetical protein
MAGFVSSGGSISWGGYTIVPTSIRFNSASAEVTSIPWLYSAKNTPPPVVPTGDFQGGGISVTYNRPLNDINFASAVGLSAPFTYTDSNGYGITGNNMLLVSMSEEVGTGAVVTATLEFTLTLFSGNNWS